ncbi:MAG: helix-turn-helix domain-containing protein [Spirochaetia bacterium]|jgi:hypothetical protein
MSEGDFRETVIARVESFRLEMFDHMRAWHDQHSALVYDLKESEKFREFQRKCLSNFGERQATLEKQMREVIASLVMGGQPASPIPRADAGKAPTPHDDITAEQGIDNQGVDLPALPKLMRYIPAPRAAALPPWREELKDAADKLGTALPPLSSIPQLAAYFHVSYGQIRNIVLLGRMAVVKQGRTIAIPRESVAEYIRIYGVPHPRRLFYGSSGVVEAP